VGNMVGCCEDSDGSEELAGAIGEVERAVEPVEPVDLELTPTNIEVAMLEIVVDDAVAPAL
jgi:hypothetical protein